MSETGEGILIPTPQISNQFEDDQILQSILQRILPSNAYKSIKPDLINLGHKCKTQRLFFGTWTSSICRCWQNIAVLVQLFTMSWLLYNLSIKTLGYHNVSSTIDQLTTTYPI